MNLLDRYLDAVQLALIGHRRADDIIAELREEILSEIEEQEAALGRRLTDDELEAVLRGHGHPLVAASRYRGRQHLIGPTMLPLYELGVIALLALAALLQLLEVATSPRPLDALAGAFGGFVNAGLTLIGFLTVVAVVLERAQVRFGFLEDWSVRDLPHFRGRGPRLEAGGPQPERIRRWVQSHSRWERLMQVVMAGLFLLWWTGALQWSPEWTTHGAIVRLAWAPVWEPLYWPVAALGVLTLAGGGVGFVAPRGRGQLVFDGLASAVGLGVVFWVLRSPPVLALRVEDADPARAAELVHGFQTGAWFVLLALGFAWLVELTRAVWGLAQDRRPTPAK